MCKYFYQRLFLKMSQTMGHFCMSQAKNIKMSPRQYFVCDAGTCLCNRLQDNKKKNPALPLVGIRASSGRSRMTTGTKLPGYTWEGRLLCLLPKPRKKHSRVFVSRSCSLAAVRAGHILQSGPGQDEKQRSSFATALALQ